MKAAYRKKRLYWNSIKNFNKRGVKTFTENNIIAAGFEFALFDSAGVPRNIFIGVNSLWKSAMYYENDIEKEIYTLTGTKEQIFKIIIYEILSQAGDLAYKMDTFKKLPKPPELGFVNFFTIGQEGRFYKKLTYREIHCSEHPYYLFYVYIKQLADEMRKAKMYSQFNINLEYTPIIIEN